MSLNEARELPSARLTRVVRETIAREEPLPSPQEPLSSHTYDSIQSQRLTREIVSHSNGFLKLRDEWDTLVNRSGATIFQSFDWLFPWWKYFGDTPDRRLRILLFRSDGVLVGIAPFFVQFHSLGHTVLSRQLRLLGCGVPANRGTYEHFAYYSPSDFLDIIVDTSFVDEIGPATAEYLMNAEETFDEVDFASVLDDSIILRYVLPAIDSDVFFSRVDRTDQCPFLPTPTSMEDYLASLKPAVRRRLQQSRAAFAGDSIATIEPISAPEYLESALQQLIAMHQGRWNALGYPGLFSDKRFLLFQKETAGCFFENGWLWFKLARYNGETIAYRMGYRFHDRVYDYLSGFDPGLPGANRRPGLALLASMFEDAIRSDSKSIELLRGDEQYKLELASNAHYVSNVLLQRRSYQQSFAARAVRCSQQWNRMRYLFHKELYLVGVQRQQHGLGFSLASYARFLLRRLAKKSEGLVKRMLPRGSPQAVAERIGN